MLSLQVIPANLLTHCQVSHLRREKGAAGGQGDMRLLPDWSCCCISLTLQASYMQGRALARLLARSPLTASCTCRAVLGRDGMVLMGLHLPFRQCMRFCRA